MMNVLQLRRLDESIIGIRFILFQSICERKMSRRRKEEYSQCFSFVCFRSDERDRQIPLKVNRRKREKTPIDFQMSKRKFRRFFANLFACATKTHRPTSTTFNDKSSSFHSLRHKSQSTSLSSFKSRFYSLLFSSLRPRR